MKKIKLFVLTVLGLFLCIYIVKIAWMDRKCYAVPILMYHYVNDDSKGGPNTISSTSFKKQLAFLNFFKYNVISLDEYVYAKKNNVLLTKKTVVLTFDDGYRDVYINAWPLLKKYGFPFIVFIPTDLVGKNENFVTWEQIKLMSDADVDFGAHSRSHSYLPNVPADIQRQEIFGSKAILEAKLGNEVKYFSYPVGGFTNDIKKLVKDAGFEAALTTNRGYDRFNNDLFELNRVRMSEADNNWLIIFGKVSGYYNAFRNLRKPHSDIKDGT